MLIPPSTPNRVLNVISDQSKGKEHGTTIVPPLHSSLVCKVTLINCLFLARIHSSGQQC